MNKKYPTFFLTWFNNFTRVPYPGLRLQKLPKLWNGSNRLCLPHHIMPRGHVSQLLGSFLINDSIFDVMYSLEFVCWIIDVVFMRLSYFLLISGVAHSTGSKLTTNTTWHDNRQSGVAFTSHNLGLALMFHEQLVEPQTVSRCCP